MEREQKENSMSIGKGHIELEMDVIVVNGI